MKVLFLRLDAPLMSFGAVAIDHHGVVQRFPTRSMLTGLVANALGWDHRDVPRLSDLQARLLFAARIDREGEALVDYQTVDLGAPWMRPDLAGWTTRGCVAERGGAIGDATHQRWRHYRADSVHTLAMAISGDLPPLLETVASALDEPARPLFIGRKPCLPATRLRLAMDDFETLVHGLASWPRVSRGDPGPLPAAWFEPDGDVAATGAVRVIPVTDERDWPNRVHAGRRYMRVGQVDPPEAVNA